MSNFKLIITDNKVMADVIATKLGYVLSDAGRTYYSGLDIEVLWTGGSLIDLYLKQSVKFEQSDIFETVEVFVCKYFNAIPRMSHGRVPELDMKRLKYIEDATSYCSEIIFMCQPTDEGQRLIHAIKLFFNFNIPTRTIIADDYEHYDLEADVECTSEDAYPVMNFMAARAMQRVFNYEFNRLNMIEVGTEVITPKAYNLFDTIRTEMLFRSSISPHFATPEISILGGTQDFNRLYVAMATKYDMTFESMWDSLLYLYAKGLINNPINSHTNSYPLSIINGDGLPEDRDLQPTGMSIMRSISCIVPCKVDKKLLHLPYNHVDKPDEFIPRTSAIYTHIVESCRRIALDEEDQMVVYAPFNERPGLSISSIMELIQHDEFYVTEGIKDSFGALIHELMVADLIQMERGFVTLTELGKTFVA